jgi:hypothetical protein
LNAFAGRKKGRIHSYATLLYCDINPGGLFLPPTLDQQLSPAIQNRHEEKEPFFDSGSKPA